MSVCQVPEGGGAVAAVPRGGERGARLRRVAGGAAARAAPRGRARRCTGTTINYKTLSH